ncbi:MAG: hypothetical protein JNG89_08965 [Planctomycetaceae bacterium]|nr:hypothetical protein [Planctomycetaceae bacterium]
MHRTIRPLLSCCLLVGCGASGPPAPETTDVAPATAPTWEQQVAAVRAGTSKRIIVADETVDAADLAQLGAGCDALEVLDLDHVDAGSAALEVIGALPNLDRLKLGMLIDDAGIERLVRAEQLTVINLPQATFTDRGLEQLADLPKLELLRFHSPNVTDDGMPYIARMPSLRFLHLIDVPITDAGLAQLHGMQQLESLYLDGGRCTESGMRALLTALPELHFHLDQLHLPGDPQADEHSPADGRTR